MMLIILFTMSIFIGLLLVVINSLIGTKNVMEREKLSAFECGFDPKSSARLPFSLHFFLIALIFLIFDVEITLILPLPLIMKFSLFNYFEFIILFFILILIFGTFIEWMEGSLDWSF